MISIEMFYNFLPGFVDMGVEALQLQGIAHGIEAMTRITNTHPPVETLDMLVQINRSLLEYNTERYHDQMDFARELFNDGFNLERREFEDLKRSWYIVNFHEGCRITLEQALGAHQIDSPPPEAY